MKFTKPNRTMTVSHRNGDVDTVQEGTPSDNAFYEFTQKTTVNVSREKKVAFHAIDVVETARTPKEAQKPDAYCQKDCSEMGDPELTVPSSTIEVEPGEEFDPMIGVSAYDDNGKNITGDVTVEVPEDTLQNEDGFDLTTENGTVIING